MPNYMQLSCNKQLSCINLDRFSLPSFRVIAGIDVRLGTNPGQLEVEGSGQRQRASGTDQQVAAGIGFPMVSIEQVGHIRTDRDGVL